MSVLHYVCVARIEFGCLQLKGLLAKYMVDRNKWFLKL